MTNREHTLNNKVDAIIEYLSCVIVDNPEYGHGNPCYSNNPIKIEKTRHVELINTIRSITND